MSRRPSTLAKLDRMRAALNHEEADRVPISDFYWGSFLERWRADLGLDEGVPPYHYYDLDWIVTMPNMDPWIPFPETIAETENQVVVRTGFGPTARSTAA